MLRKIFSKPPVGGIFWGRGNKKNLRWKLFFSEECHFFGEFLAGEFNLGGMGGQGGGPTPPLWGRFIRGKRAGKIPKKGLEKKASFSLACFQKKRFFFFFYLTVKNFPWGDFLLQAFFWGRWAGQGGGGKRGWGGELGGEPGGNQGRGGGEKLGLPSKKRIWGDKKNKKRGCGEKKKKQKGGGGGI